MSDTKELQASVPYRADGTDVGEQGVWTDTKKKYRPENQVDTVDNASVPTSKAVRESAESQHHASAGRSLDHWCTKSNTLTHRKHGDGAVQGNHFLPSFVWQLLDTHDVRTVELPPSLVVRDLPSCGKCSHSWGV